MKQQIVIFLGVEKLTPFSCTLFSTIFSHFFNIRNGMWHFVIEMESEKGARFLEKLFMQKSSMHDALQNAPIF